MCHCHNHGIHVLHMIHGVEGNAVKAFCLIRIRRRIYNHGGNAVLTQFLVNIDDLGISGVGTILLKGKSEDGNLSALYGDICLNQVLHHGLCHIFTHIVVDAASGKNDLGMVAQLLCLIGQIVRIHTDTVTSHKSRLEF